MTLSNNSSRNYQQPAFGISMKHYINLKNNSPDSAVRDHLVLLVTQL